MGIKELTAETLGKKKTTEWRFDKKRELWVTYQARGEFDGAPHVRRGFKTAKAAADYLASLKVQSRLKQIGVVDLIKFPTVKKLFAVHLSKHDSKKSRTAANRAFTKFLSLLPANFKINELKRKHFKDFVDLRFKEGVKPETADREITDISAALHKAGEYFAELENWTVPKIYRPVTGDAGRSRIITGDEWTRILKYLMRAADPSEREKDYRARRRTALIFYFGLLTGLRHGEITGLLKCNFDRRARSLRAERFKTRKSGVSWTTFEPLTETQVWVLNEAESLYPNGEFFFSDSGKPHNKFYDIMEAACKKLKIAYGKNNPNGFVMHDTRHTFVTTLEHGAVDSSTTRSFSGHSRDGMMKRYAHATPDSRARAMRIVEKEFGASFDEGFDSTAREEKLKSFYEAVQNKQISFDQFKIALESFDGFLTQEKENAEQNVRIVRVGI